MYPVLVTAALSGRPLVITSYGVCLALAWAVGVGFWLWRLRWEDVGAVVAVSGAAFAGAAVGAGALSWLVSGQFGWVFLGGLAGGFLAGFTLARRLPVRPAVLLEALPLPLALGHALGRLGCFLGGCCFGRSSTLPWAVQATHPLAPASHPPLWRHPVPLYEGAGVLILAWLVERRASGRFWAYLLGYALLRFGLEALRGDEVRGHLGALSTSQWGALVLLLALLGWAALARRPRLAFGLRRALLRP